jgi:nonsense-mediated mRNA decay protein 3
LELFLRDIEEDPELRGMINLYKGAGHGHDGGGSGRANENKETTAAVAMEDDETVDDHADDVDAMQDDDGELSEEDFPEIDESELLDELMDGMKIDSAEQ